MVVYRDGRLRTNDQLLNVNGVSLLGLNNSAAMEALRKALVRATGPVSGCITLSVARRVPELTSPGHKRRDSLTSLLTDSSGNNHRLLTHLMHQLECMYILASLTHSIICYCFGTVTIIMPYLTILN